jgi:hypothetical protein
MSRQHDVGFRDACRILESDDVFWGSLLMFALYVTDDHSRTVVVASSTCVSS